MIIDFLLLNEHISDSHIIERIHFISVVIFFPNSFMCNTGPSKSAVTMETIPCKIECRYTNRGDDLQTKLLSELQLLKKTKKKQKQIKPDIDTFRPIRFEDSAVLWYKLHHSKRNTCTMCFSAASHGSQRRRYYHNRSL